MTEAARVYNFYDYDEYGRARPQSYDSDNKSNTSSFHEINSEDSLYNLMLTLKENGCDQYNWNGYNSNPVDSGSLIMASGYIKKLKPQIPQPDFTVEPSGILSMCWYGEKGSFILAFNAAKRRVEFSLALKGIDGEFSFGIMNDVNDLLFYIRKIGEWSNSRM